MIKNSKDQYLMCDIPHKFYSKRKEEINLEGLPPQGWSLALPRVTRKYFLNFQHFLLDSRTRKTFPKLYHSH